MTIQPAAGSRRLSVGSQILEVEVGDIAVPGSAIEHEVEALEESGLLLTLVKPM